MPDAGPRHVDADGGHAVLEALAVFRLLDRIELCPDELAAVPGQDPLFRQLHRQVQRRLAAHGGEDGVGAFDSDDPLRRFHGDGFDVGAIGPLRVRHDRRGIGVQEDGAVPLFPQRLQRLHARVIELAGLPDDDGTRAEEENGLEVFSSGHLGRRM